MRGSISEYRSTSLRRKVPLARIALDDALASPGAIRPLPASGARWSLSVRIGIDQAAPAGTVERLPCAFVLREAIGHRIDDCRMMAHAAMAAFDLDAFCDV